MAHDLWEQQELEMPKLILQFTSVFLVLIGL
jgi:hypothetical protein